MSTESDVQLRSPGTARIVMQGGEWGKTKGGGVKRTTRTEIRVETYELLVVRKRGNLARGWCEHCGKRVGMICLEDMTRAGLSQAAVYQQAEAGRLHFIEVPQSPLFVCLNSLME